MMTKPIQHASSNTQSVLRRAMLSISCAACCAITTTAYATPGDGLRAQEVSQALGLTAETLACVDVHGEEPAIVLERLVEEYSTYQQLLSLQQQIIDQQRIVYDAKAILRDIAENADAQAALAAAQAQIVTLKTQASITRDTLIATALDGLADNAMIDEVIDAQGVFVALPPAYRIAVDTVREARELSWALKMQQRADTNSGDLSDNAQQILAQANSQVSVQTARARVDTYTDSNKQAIDSWIAGN